MPAFAAFATRADGTIQQDHYVIATFVFISVEKSHDVLNFAAHRFPCSTAASAPRPRPARTPTASSPCRSKRSASSHTTRACPYLLSISLARRRRPRVLLLMYICVHLANAATGGRRRGSWRADVSVEECSWELTSSSSRAACGRRDRSAALSLRRRPKKRN